MLKLKKAIIAVSILATVLSPAAIGAHAYYGNTNGTLNVSKHWVPVLKDSARGNTNTNYGHKETGFDDSKLWTRTSVTAYNKDDYTTASCSNSGVAALEGWDSAEAKIRNIQSANGTHTGGSNGIGSVTAYTSWTN